MTPPSALSHDWDRDSSCAEPSSFPVATASGQNGGGVYFMLAHWYGLLAKYGWFFTWSALSKPSRSFGSKASRLLISESSEGMPRRR